MDVARAAIASAVEAGDAGSAPARAHLGAALEQRRLLQPVINATGVLLHTNMGRAPLAVHRPAGYTNLELDLARGQRGDRSAHAARFLARAGGAEAALIVNNGAAAIFLVLATLAAGREVIVSRGELVEIGGGFRIPEVLESSGARLVEVGTTNRTRLSDYQRAVGEHTALVLKVHASNYRITGFVASVGVAELVELAGQAGHEVRAGRGPAPEEADGGRGRSPWSWTSGRVCSTPTARGSSTGRHPGWPTNRPSARRWPRAPPSSRSAATSCSAGPRPG